MVFEFFKKYLFSQRAGAIVRRISWITIVALTVSISALIVVLSVMNALNKKTQERTLAVEPHLHLLFPEIHNGRLVEAHPALVAVRAASVKNVFVTESQDFILRTLDGRIRGAKGRGLSVSDLNELFHKIYRSQKKEGSSEPDRFVKVIPQPGEVILGADLAVSLGVFEGDTLLVLPPEQLLLPPGETPKYERVRVKRILATDIADVDAEGVFYVRGESFNKLRDSSSLKYSAEIWLQDVTQVDQLKQQLLRFSGTQVETWKERNSALFLALRLEKSVIALFLSLAALISGFSLVTLVVLLISQKKKEIGLLQTLGFSPAGVRELFLKLGVILGGFGLGGGLLIGTAVSFYLEKKPLNVLPEVYIDSQISADINLTMLFFIAIIGIALIFLGSWLSSKTVLELTPSESLRAKN